MTNNPEGTQGNPSKKLTCELSKLWQASSQNEKAKAKKTASVVNQPAPITVQAEATTIGRLRQREMKDSTLGKLVSAVQREKEQEARRKLFPQKA